MTISFDGSKLKVSRAEHHISGIESTIRAFTASDYYSLTAEYNARTGNNALKFRVKSLPVKVPLAIGDAIHNLRTALDFLTSDVVYHHNGKRSTYTKFPIYETREKLISALDNGTIRQASFED